jgi:hypothetical protein
MTAFPRLVTRVHWWLIERELIDWKAGGRTPRFWWRDDDARSPSPALTRLLGLSESFEVPLALAVIPDGNLIGLAKAIGRHPRVSVIQHGCDHVDRNRGGGFPAEFDPTAPVATVAAKIAAGWRALSEVFDPTPVFAPPWNRLTPNALAALCDTPLRAVSIYGAAAAGPDGVVEINTHIDIMRWRPARFRGENAILRRLWRQLRRRRRHRRWREPIGLLTHHKNLDETAWRFLEAFLRRFPGTRRPALWHSIDLLLQDDRPPSRTTPGC